MSKNNKSTLGIKILAVFIALLIWIYVFYQEGRAGDKTFVSIPIVAQSVPKDMILMNSNSIPTATVKLFGSERTLETIDRDNISAYIDLLNSSPGSKQVKVECRFPNERVNLSSISPKTVTVELQLQETVELDIKYEYVGDPSINITIDEPSFEPSTLKITGPHSTVSTLKNAFVSIDRTSINAGSNSYSLPIMLENNTGNRISKASWEILHLSSEHETVSAVVLASSNTKSFKIPTELKTIGFVSTNYIIDTINWEPKLVSIEGEAETLKNINRIYSKPLNLSALSRSSSYKLPLIAPEGTSLIDEDSISVSVSVKQVISRTLRDIPVNVTPDNIQYELITKTIEVTIKGPKDVVESINSVTGSIDLSGLSGGIHMLPVSIEGLPDNVYLIYTPTASIKIL
jgi:YbbR domain-containing protein